MSKSVAWDGETLPWHGVMSDKDYFGLNLVDRLVEADQPLSSYHVWDQTQLKHWMTSPLDWVASQDAKPTAAMVFGTAAHALVLGSGAPVASAEYSLRSKAGREEAEDAKQQGVTLLRPTDFTAVHDMADITHPVFERMCGHPEVTMLAKLATSDKPQCEIYAKGKADWVMDGVGEDGVWRIWDYKTTSAPLDDFARQAVTGGYDIQAAYYLALADACGMIPADTTYGFGWLVQEKTPPYEYREYTVDDDSDVLLNAADLISAIIHDINNFITAGRSLGALQEALADGRRKAKTVRQYARPAEQLEWPTWAYTQREQQIEGLLWPNKKQKH